MAKLPPDWPELIADYVRAFHAQIQNSPKHHLEFVAKHHEHLLKQTPGLPLTPHRPNGRTAPPSFEGKHALLFPSRWTIRRNF